MVANSKVTTRKDKGDQKEMMKAAVGFLFTALGPAERYEGE